MASRQEEKERRRQERMEREAAEAKSAANRRRLQFVGGGVLALVALGAVVFVLLTALGGDDGGDGPRRAASGDDAAQAAAKLPEQEQTDVEKAAKAAGCELTHPEYEGAGHEDRTFKPDDYRTNPPTSGSHNPSWYEDGIYGAGDTPRLGELVHTLEHGRINIQYKPGTPPETVAQLEALVAENDGYHMVMYENTTNMTAAVAATAWTHSLTCDEMNPKVFDAMRTFRDKYLDKGPEQIP